MDVKTLQKQFKLQQLQQKRKIRVFQWLLLIGLFLIWELATRYRLLDPLIFTSPTILSAVPTFLISPIIFADSWSVPFKIPCVYVNPLSDKAVAS